VPLSQVCVKVLKRFQRPSLVKRFQHLNENIRVVLVPLLIGFQGNKPYEQLAGAAIRHVIGRPRILVLHGTGSSVCIAAGPQAGPCRHRQLARLETR
jgi:hypothetical protein